MKQKVSSIWGGWKGAFRILPGQYLLLCSVALFAVLGCSSTEIVESPKTAYVADGEAPTQPKIIWTSRNLGREYDYLGIVKTRAWSYEGALSRLREGGGKLRADAIIDIHYEPVGFFSEMQAFAIKFRSEQ